MENNNKNNENNENNKNNENNENNNDNMNNTNKNKKLFYTVIILIVLSVILLISNIITVVLVLKKDNQNKKTELEYNPEVNQDAYFEEHSEIIEANEAKEDNAFSEEEVVKFLDKRGLYGKITTFYDINGNELDEKEISPTSKEKHPEYSLMYKDEDEAEGSIWYVLVIGKEITAYPFEYNAANNAGILNAVLETDFLVSYDSEKNRFLKTTPNKEQLVVTKVEKIDKETLNGLENTKFHYSK